MCLVDVCCVFYNPGKCVVFAVLQGFLADTLPAPYGQEIKGIANITGLPLGKSTLVSL